MRKSLVPIFSLLFFGKTLSASPAIFGDSIANFGIMPITITSDCSPKEFCLWQNNCNFGTAQLSATGEGGCSDISFTWQMDLHNNGTYDELGAGATIIDTFPAGTHRILWKAKDNCGAATTCQYTFKSKDCSPPNLLIINGVTLPLQAPDCTASVTANQFLLNISDNCTPINQIQLGIRRVGSGTGFPPANLLTLTKCQSGTNLVEIWAKDNVGNETKFTGYVIAQDNQGACPCVNDTIRFGGTISSALGQPVRNTLLNIQVGGGSAAYPITYSPVVFDTLTGDYFFDIYARPKSTPYTVSIIPRKLTDPLNGVSTFDQVAISKHVLNVVPFTSIYKMIASDINFNNQVTTFDIVELRKLILGQYSGFDTNTSWRFVVPPTDPTDLAQLPDLVDFYTRDFIVIEGQPVPDFLGNHFIGVKIGDPNLSADPKL